MCDTLDHEHDPLRIRWKFNGGNPWWICDDCRVRVCGEELAELWVLGDDLPIIFRCTKPAMHEEPCFEDSRDDGTADEDVRDDPDA